MRLEIKKRRNICHKLLDKKIILKNVFGVAYKIDSYAIISIEIDKIIITEEFLVANTENKPAIIIKNPTLELF